MVKSRRIRCIRHVARRGQKMNAYWILVGRPEGKRPLERPILKWENDIKWIIER
jgi:hypothetical protein